MPRISITGTAQEKVGDHVKPGDQVIDATAGNGHDTLFLAQAVQSAGHVWALDIQQAALESTARRLSEAGVQDRVTLIQGSHAHMAGLLPQELAGQVTAIMFNLGYLPGSDKAMATATDTTLQALEAARALLAPGGILSVVAYLGHPGGREEFTRVQQWFRDSTLLHEGLPLVASPSRGPALFIGQNPIGGHPQSGD